MKVLVIIALTLVAVWAVTEARSKDSIVVRVFNKNLDISSAKMHAILKKANLEAHGYKLEVTTQMTRQPGSKRAEYIKTYYYYKTVTCDKAYEVEQELDRLLGGSVLGASVSRKAKKDFKELNIGDKTKTCKSGLEVHFRNQQHCGKVSNDGDRAKRSPCGSWICGGCWRLVK